MICTDKQKMRDKILTDIYNNPEIDKMIKRVVFNYSDVNDVRSVFFEQVCKIDTDKLIKLAEDPNQLKFFCVKIVMNQYRSNASLYYRTYKKDYSLAALTDDVNKQLRKLEENPYLYQTKKLNKEVITNDELYDIVKPALRLNKTKDTESFNELKNHDEFNMSFDDRNEKEMDEDILIEIIKEEIKQLKWDERSIFEEIVFGGKKVRQVATERDINYETIHRKYQKAISKLKTKLKEKWNYTL